MTKPIFDLLTCQICGGEYAAREGLIANHGFQRNAGWNSDGCAGSRELPLEVGRDVIANQIIQWEQKVKELSRLPIATNIDLTSPVDHVVTYARRIQAMIADATRNRDGYQAKYDAWVQTISDDDWQSLRDRSLANRSRATAQGWTHRYRPAKVKPEPKADAPKPVAAAAKAFLVEHGVQVAMFTYAPTGRTIFECIPNGNGAWDVIDSHADVSTVPPEIARQLGSAAA